MPECTNNNNYKFLKNYKNKHFAIFIVTNVLLYFLIVNIRIVLYIKLLKWN